MNSDKLFSLEHLKIVRVSGPEAQSFLQRQLTCDMLEISPDRFRSGAYLTPNGRVLANFLVLRHENDYLLITAASVAENFTKRLQMYVMRSDVDVSLDAQLALAGAVGDLPANGFADQQPAHQGDVVVTGNLVLFQMFGAGTRIGIAGPAEEIARLPSLTADSTPWEACDISEGYPLIVADTSETFTAQAINLDLIGAVSFTKGCFPGQEILARQHYRGRSNRRVFRAVVDAAAPPAPGTDVRCDAFGDSQLGTVVNSANLAGRTEALISIPLKFLDQRSLRVSGSEEVTVLRDAMAYEIPETAR